jgi:hypothetical protein
MGKSAFPRPGGGRKRSPHDQLFKELIGAFLPDFLHLAAPETAGRLDLSHWRLLDKEAFTDWPRGRRRELDLLAEVGLKESGGNALIHVEIEVRARPGIGLRLAGYYMQLRIRHGRPVLPVLLCLRRGRPGVVLEQVTDAVLGPEIGRFRYYAFCLAGCCAEDYLARPEPLAWALSSLMRRERLSAAEHKAGCLRRIFSASGLDELRRFLLAHCVETYLELQGRDVAEFEALWSREPNREARTMFMTWSERLEAKGWERGLETGIEQGLEQIRQILLRQLSLRFGTLPARVRQRVDAIRSVDRLTSLAEQVLVARSLDEIDLR